MSTSAITSQVLSTFFFFFKIYLYYCKFSVCVGVVMCTSVQVPGESVSTTAKVTHCCVSHLMQVLAPELWFCL